MNDSRFRIGHIKISITNPKDTKRKITEAALNNIGGYICVSNLRMIRYAEGNKDYAKLMDKSFMNVPDGVPLTWFGKAWGLKDIDVTRGPGLFKEMLKNGHSDLRHFLIGDTKEVLSSITSKYNGKNGCKIVGSYSPPFVNVQEFDYLHIAQLIKDTNANIVWTAMTAPKQDEFNRELNKYLPNIMSIGVGRAFRLSIGEVKSAPMWANKLGIGGFFMRRREWYKTGWWYISNSLIVAKYIFQILYWNLTGKKYYE